MTTSQWINLKFLFTFVENKIDINTMNDIKGVLFDLDGVLIDTEGIYTQFWQAVDKRFPTGVENFAQVIKGSNLHNILHTYFPSPEMREQVNALLNDFQRDMRYEYFPGTVTLLDELKRRNIPLCIVTSSDPDKMRELYRQKPEFSSYFQAIVTGDMVSEPKPSPECYLLGAKQLGIAIEDCCVVEDSINGLKAGMASGAHVAGIPSTCPRESIAAHCHWIIERVEQLVDIIFPNVS